MLDRLKLDPQSITDTLGRLPRTRTTLPRSGLEATRMPANVKRELAAAG
jgi:hypothetical protein